MKKMMFFAVLIIVSMTAFAQVSKEEQELIDLSNQKWTRFAHLAVGTNGRSSESRRARSDGRVVTDEDEVNPDRPAVVWTDEMLSKEEYERLPKE